MKIQQHDGVVVDAGRHSSRASPRLRGRGVTEGEGGARGLGAQPSLPPLYRGPGGALAPGRSNLQGGGGQGGWLAPPSQVGRPHP